MKEFAVYTSIFNKYDKLRDPRIIDEGTDYYCFTDDPTLKSPIWKVILVEGGSEAVKRNRQLKMLIPEVIRQNYATSVYIDGNIQICSSLLPLIKESIAEADLAIPLHPERNCAYDEIDECLELRIISPELAIRWKAILTAGGLPKNFGLFENNVMIRRHSDELLRLMQYWHALYDAHGGRDQFSLTLSRYANSFPVNAISEGPRVSYRYFKIFAHTVPNVSFIRYFLSAIRINRHKNRLFAVIASLLDKR